MKTVRLILAIHNHQPVGNFDHVFRRACDRAYRPFLEEMDRWPWMRFVLHFSGSLLEWVEAKDRGLVDTVRRLVDAGRVEVLGGGYYEPILTMLAERDRVGQIALYGEHLGSLFGACVRGAWVAERVWEQCLVTSLAAAGIEYTVLDDFHFKNAGLRDQHLTGYYLTEDQGRLLKVFPGSEKLRYLIPFGMPEETIDYLRQYATQDGRNVIVYADDGEKFGIWPQTHEHVYRDRWLRRFMEALDANREWIRVVTFSDVADDTPPLGKVYLPDASYREMTEWALPADTLMEYEDIERDMRDTRAWSRVRPFVRGGFWRNFKAMYPEADRMYARMMQVSETLARVPPGQEGRDDALRELYRGQCNCGYWHGVFGGLYLPHLRFETYRHLIRAETLAGIEAPGSETCDYDLDGHPDVRLSNARLNAYICPAHGGHLYELDHRGKAFNLLATLARRKEAYHRKLLAAAAAPGHEESVASIHDRVKAKEKGLEKHIAYDRHLRDCFIEHFLPRDVTPRNMAACRYPELGDFADGAYQVVEMKGHPRCVRMERVGRVIDGDAAREAAVSKSFRLEPGALAVDYDVALREDLSVPVWFAIELNFGLLAGRAPDRYYQSEDGDKLGHLSARIRRGDVRSLSLIDEWLGVEVRVDFEPAAAVWTYPVETVSESEDGFERNYQCSCVIARWPLDRSASDPGQRLRASVTVALVDI